MGESNNFKVWNEDGTPVDPNGFASWPHEKLIKYLNEKTREADMALHDRPPGTRNGTASSAIEAKESPSADDPQATPLFGFEKPDPLRWQVAGLIPEGHVSLLAADSDTGKSFLAVYLALRICMGEPFFGLKTRRGRVLYVDYELDADEQRRRVWRVAAGLGMTVDDPRLQERFFYYRPTALLGTDAAHNEVLKLIDRHEIDLVILDSLTVSSTGDVQDQADVVPKMQRFREWGTVFALDHVTHQAARGNASEAHPFGSRFKRHMARSTLNMAKADGGGRILAPDKGNFTGERDQVCFAMEFDGPVGPVRFEKVKSTDSAMAGALSDMSSHEVTLAAINDLYSGVPVSARAVLHLRRGPALSLRLWRAA